MATLERAVKAVGPFRLFGKVVEGFKRGSKELGWPTANLDPAAFEEKLDDSASEGVYIGWASIEDESLGVPSRTIHKAILSIGWNPFYKNEKRTVEAYLCHDFGRDFYGAEMRLLVCACIRPQADFSSMDELIKAIQDDVDYGSAALGAPPLSLLQEDDFFPSAKAPAPSS